MATTLGVLAGTAAIVAPVASAKPDGQIGARSLDDPLFPQLGNGGYDVEHYRIKLDYDPVANSFNSASTRIVATATQKLREFSLDFQDLDVTRVRVNGRDAEFSQVEATPDLSPIPGVTQPMKLVVEPAPNARPKKGREFTVSVRYEGDPQPITDPDESIEGWIRACYPLSSPRTCDGAFVVNEPMGAQSWFPSNNYPTDKATFDTLIRVPNTKTALGVGELAAHTDHGDGTSTWHWSEDDPTATYLTTATVGNFIYTVGPMVEDSTGRTLPVYNAIDASATPTQLAAINAALAVAPEQLNFFSDIFGAYPFDSTGAVADRAAGVGYALEVQTKPHYSGGFSSGNPSISLTTQAHEIAHQWFGNSATLETWADIWFNEGWANWSDWYWAHLENGGDSPADLWQELYDDPGSPWEIAPAVLDGDPAKLFFPSFPTYDRGAMTLEGYRQIIGDARFFEFARELLDRFAYDNISTAEFIEFAKEFSGFEGAELALLDDYFQQWLYGTERPTIVAADFGP